MAKQINFRQKLYTLSTASTEDGSLQQCYGITPFVNMRYFQVMGVSKARGSECVDAFYKYVDVLSGISIAEFEYQFILFGEKNRITIIVGANDQYYDVVKNLYYAIFDGIEIHDINDTFLKNKLRKCNCGGAVIGYPSVKLDSYEQNRSELNVTDSVIRGMADSYWVFAVSAKAVSSQQAEEICQSIRDELRTIMPYVRKSVSGQGLDENEQMEIIDYDAQEYQNRLQIFCDKMDDARLEGMWRSSCFFAADSSNACKKLSRILHAKIGGCNSVPFNIKTVFFDKIDKIINNYMGLFTDRSGLSEMPFLMDEMPVNEEPYCFYSYKYQIPMGAKELASLIMMPMEEVPGFYINQPLGFDSAPRRNEDEFEIGSIVHNGRVMSDVCYAISIDSLTKHCLVNGITGGGKSNTSKYLLTTLFTDFQIPFLVIESAKREYYELGRILKQDVFIVFTLGQEGKDAVGYRINPFERIGSVPLQTHIDYLLASFKASFEMVPPMPYILETSVYAVYKDYGWDVINDVNIFGKNEYPTIEDLYYKIEIIADEYGYAGEMRSNIISALQARIGSLRIGGKGAMLNTNKSFPIEKLLEMPTVLELDAIGDDDVKAFVISIILVQLYEFRKSEMKDSTKKGLLHILLIEEAHRLLKNVSMGNETANPQGKAVEFFCNMLAEIRSYGQGIFISDQMPTKLAPDVLKNTNLKICHRIVTREDRELLGTAMNMNDEQVEAISMLKTGYAAVYSEGDSRPMLVKLPLMRDKVNKTRAQILEASRNLISTYMPPMIRKKGNGIACSLCSNCKYKMKIEQMFEDGIIQDDYINKIIGTIQKCSQIDGEFLDIFFKTIEKKFVKRQLLTEEKLCIIYQIEDKFSVSKAYIRAALIDAVNR